jgi:ElaA protein
MAELKWRYEPFARLTAGEIYQIVHLRQRVFVVEQKCPYQDADGIDPVCHHLWTENDRGAVLAYLRVVPAGATYAEPSLGRIVTAPETRRSGLGRALMVEGLARLRATFGPTTIRIGAQKYLERFYGSFGFVRASEDYLEDDIPHVEMLLSS